MKTINAQKEYRKRYYENGTRYRLTVIAELHKLGSNPRPHFSATGSLDYQARNNRWVNIKAGCIHEDILKRIPELAPVIAVHLADDDGVPMHAYENASYWAGHTKYQDLDLDALARHLRISTDLARDMHEHILHFYGEFDSITTPVMAWQQTCEDYNLPEQWKAQANEAIKILNNEENTQ